MKVNRAQIVTEAYKEKNPLYRKTKGISQECHHDRKLVYLNILITSREKHPFDDNHITNST